MIRTFVITLAAFLALALFAVACGGRGDGRSSEVTPSVTASPENGIVRVPPGETITPIETPVVTPTPTPSPELTSTPKPATPAPTPEPPSANPVPGSCLIFEEKYCKTGTLEQWETPWGATQSIIALSLPTETTIFAPFDVTTGLSKGGSAFGPEVSVFTFAIPNDPDQKLIQIHGDLSSIQAGPFVRQGEPVDVIAGTGLKPFKEYNLVVSVAKFDPAKLNWVTDEEWMRNLFPSVFR